MLKDNALEIIAGGCTKIIVPNHILNWNSSIPKLLSNT